VPATSFNEYADRITKTVQQSVFSGLAVQHELQVDRRSPQRGLIAGVLTFKDGSELHFREFIDMTCPEPRLKYAYHYQAQDRSLIFRYDNAAHKPALPQDEHKHTERGVELSNAPTLRQVLDEILDKR
jgi:hypothetical protein